MISFYKTMYDLGYLDKSDVHEAAYWGVITLDEYKQITGIPF